MKDLNLKVSKELEVEKTSEIRSVTVTTEEMTDKDGNTVTVVRQDIAKEIVGQLETMLRRRISAVDSAMLSVYTREAYIEFLEQEVVKVLGEEFAEWSSEKKGAAMAIGRQQREQEQKEGEDAGKERKA